MHFRFLNIPVQIHPSFWIFVIFFTNIYRDPSIYSVIIGVVLLMSLLVHEYGHALTALYYGAEPTICLEAFGGKAYYDNRGMSPWQEFLITLNGPLLESLLILISYSLLKSGVFTGHAYIQFFLYVTLRVNILWCLLNLIPVTPLDGGHLLRYFLEKKWGDKGHKISLMIGLMTVAVIAPYLYFKGLYFFGTLLLILGFQNFQMLRYKRFSPKESPFKTYIQGMEALENNDLEKGKNLLKKLLKSKDPQIKQSATESLATIYAKENDIETSYRLLLQSNHEALKEGKYLLCKLAFQQKNYSLVTQYSHDIYELHPTFETALLNSQAFAQQNDPELAGGWLETATLFSPEAHTQAKLLIQDPLYDPIRHHPMFTIYLNKLFPQTPTKA